MIDGIKMLFKFQTSFKSWKIKHISPTLIKFLNHEHSPTKKKKQSDFLEIKKNNNKKTTFPLSPTINYLSFSTKKNIQRESETEQQKHRGSHVLEASHHLLLEPPLPRNIFSKNQLHLQRLLSTTH